MVAQIIQGQPGAGKSYHAVQRIEAALRSGRVVLTNMPLKLSNPFYKEYLENGNLIKTVGPSNVEIGKNDHFGEFEFWEKIINEGEQYLREVQVEKTKTKRFLFWKIKTTKKEKAKKQGPLIVIDEAVNTLQDIYSRRKKTTYYDDICAYFRVHRHHLADIILMYHGHSDVPTEIKSLIHRWHTVTNTKEMTGLPTWRMTTNAKGFNAGNAAINKSSGRFKKSIFELYDSHSEGAGKGEDGEENTSGLIKSTPIWRRWWFLAFVVMPLITIPIFMVKTAKNIKGVITQEADSTLEIQQTNAKRHKLIEPAADRISKNDIEPEARAIINPQAFIDGLPQEDAVLLGFDNHSLYFAGGIVVRRNEDLTPKQWKVLEASPCNVVISKYINETNATYTMRYVCGRGF